MLKKRLDTIIEILIIFVLIAVLYNIAIYYFGEYKQKQEFVLNLKTAYTDVQNIFDDEEKFLQFFNFIKRSCDYNSADIKCESFFRQLKQNGADFYIAKPINYKLRYLSQEKHSPYYPIKENKEVANVYNGNVLKFSKGYHIFNYHFYRNPRLDRESEKFYGERAYSYFGIFDIDVNGEKGPNVYGRDLFRFLLLDDGTIYPYRGINYEKNCKKHKFGKNNIAGNSGFSCAAKVMVSGWKMKY